MKFNYRTSSWLRACVPLALIAHSIALPGCGGENAKDSDPAELESSPAPVAEAGDPLDKGSDTLLPEAEPPTDWRELWDAAAFSQLVKDADYHLANGSEGVRETLALVYLFLGDRAAAEATASPLEEGAPLRVFLSAMAELYEDSSNTDKAQALMNALDSWEVEEESQEAQWKLNARGFALSELGMRAMSFQSFVQCVNTWPENAVALRNLARSYRAAQMPEFAVSTMRQWVSRHGDNLEARQIFAQTLLELGRIDEAQAFADEVYARLPNDPAAIANLARVYLLQGDVDVAEQLLDQTVKNQPGEMTIRLLLASAQLRNGHSETALKTLASTEVPDGMRVSAVEIEAFAYMDAARFSDVIAALDRFGADELSPALRFLKVAARIAANETSLAAGDIPDPGTVPILASDPSQVLSGALGLSADFSDAADGELAGALARNSGATVDFAFGVASYSAGLNEKAYSLFESVIEQLGDNARAASYSLSALARSKNVRGVSALADTAVETYSGNSETWMAASLVYRANDNDDAQRHALDRAVELAPAETQPLRMRANLAIADEDDALALALFERLLALLPEGESPGERASAMNNISYYITNMGGDLEAAIDYAEKALALIPNNPNVLHTLGWAQLEAGRLDEAEKNIGLSLQQRPGDPTITLDFGRLLIAQGRVEDGLKQVGAAIVYADQLGLDFARRAEATTILRERAPSAGDSRG